MNYHSLKNPFENMEDQLFNIISETWGYKEGFEKIMKYYDKLNTWGENNDSESNGKIITELLAGMGLAGIAVPVAFEIFLETPVRAIYGGIKKVEDYYSGLS